MRFPLILRTDKWYRYFMASLGTPTNLLRSKWSSSRKICLANRPSGRELNSLPPNLTTFRLVFSDHRADDMLVNPHLSISSLWRSTRGARLRLLAGFLARMLVTLLRLLPIMPRIFMYYFHGGVESTVIERRQQQLSRMADFLPLITFSVFLFIKPWIKSQTMRHPLMNLVNTTLSQKYGDP